MKPIVTSLKRPAIAFAALGLCIAAGSAPAAAQSEHCADLYSRVMAVYQTAPYSPEYSQISARYAARCLSGASPGPAAYSAPYQAPYTSYQQPVAVFPGAVIVGGQEGGYRYDGEGRYR